MKMSTKADFYLLLIALFWGMTFPLIKNAINHVDAYTFVWVRFTLSALVLLPFVFKHLKATRWNLLLACMILGLLNAEIYTLQTASLAYISASRCAFITGIGVVLVPLFAPLFKLGKISFFDIACGSLCLVGLFILTGSDFGNVGLGDLWSCFCAYRL